MAFDRFNEKPRRPRFDREDRGERFGRSEDRGNRFSDRSERFGDERGERFGRSEDRGERRFGGERPRFGDKPRFGGDRPRFGGKPGFKKFDGERRDSFGSHTGPRAKALEVRRYSDHAAFAKTATVRLDADVAAVFKSQEAVNDALRQLIALSRMIPVAQEVASVEIADETVEQAESIEEVTFPADEAASELAESEDEKDGE